MFRRRLRLFVIALTVIVTITCFSSCKEDDGSGYTFKINLAGNPQNLDPQLAEDVSSKIVISNMMCGLVKTDDNGAIIPDAAESYSISDDGLVYTFELKENIFWESENGYKAALTADDFVFAFHRIYDSEALYSPYVDYFICIKNAEAVSRAILDKSELGVKALSDHTLQIELEYPYYNFLGLLTSTAAMPCNKAFFESTKGRYGLSAETTVSNGAFYLKEWNYDPYWDNNYIIMRRNKSNSEQDYVYPYSLNFFIKKSSENDTEDYLSENVDCLITENYDKKAFSGSNYSEYSLKSFGLLFNTKSKYFSQKNFRLALASAFRLDNIPSESGYSTAYGIVPDDVTVMGRKYREMISDESMLLYDKSKALSLWTNALSSQNAVSVDGVKITVPESFGGSDHLSLITEQWQQNLDFFCGIEVVSQNEYDLKIKEGSFDIALVEIDTTNGSPNDYFEFFTDKNKDFGSYINFSASGYIQQLKRAESLNEAVEIYTQAERQIIDSAVYIPLFYGNKYFVCPEKSYDICFDPLTGEINFRYAKMFD